MIYIRTCIYLRTYVHTYIRITQSGDLSSFQRRVGKLGHARHCYHLLRSLQNARAHAHAWPCKIITFLLIFPRSKAFKTQRGVSWLRSKSIHSYVRTCVRTCVTNEVHFVWFHLHVRSNLPIVNGITVRKTKFPNPPIVNDITMRKKE